MVEVNGGTGFFGYCLWSQCLKSSEPNDFES
jgi:hypothetical protein